MIYFDYISGGYSQMLDELDLDADEEATRVLVYLGVILSGKRAAKILPPKKPLHSTGNSDKIM